MRNWLVDAQLREPSVVAAWRMNQAVGSASAVDSVNLQNLVVTAPAALGNPGALTGDFSTMAVSGSTGGKFSVSGDNILPFMPSSSWTIEAVCCAEPSGHSYTLLGVASSFAVEVVTGTHIRVTAPISGAATLIIDIDCLTGGPDLVQVTSDGSYVRVYVNGIRVYKSPAALPLTAPSTATGQTIQVLAPPVFVATVNPWTAIGQCIALYSAALGDKRCASHYVAMRQINTDRAHVSTYAPISIP